MSNLSCLNERSFMAAGCGQSRFATLGAYREFGECVRMQQAAIIARRAALVAGLDEDDAAFDLHIELERLGMDHEDIQGHIRDPQKDVDDLFVHGSDLVEAPCDGQGS